MPFLVQLKAPTFPPALMRDGVTMRKMSHVEACLFETLPAFAHEDRSLMIQEVTAEQAETYRAHTGKVVIKQVAQFSIDLVPYAAAPTPPPPEAAKAATVPPLQEPKKAPPKVPSLQRQMDAARKRF